jgi:AcrR family transcriptional regulator
MGQRFTLCDVTVKGRREEYAEATRSAIVEAAISRFRADGFAKTTMDSIAETARVTKGGVYHHFKDKAELFEAAFVAMEERLVGRVVAGAAGARDPWEVAAAGIEVFLAECSEPDFRRIALEEAPAALGWGRWKQIEEKYFLDLVKAALNGLAQAGHIEPPDGDLAARVVLAAMGEAGLQVAASADVPAERERARHLLLRMLTGFSAGAPLPRSDG